MKVMICAGIILGSGLVASGEEIRHGNTEVEMTFVSIANTGNPAHESGYGAVDYEYQIATCEVTADQWDIEIVRQTSGMWGVA